MGVVTLRVFSFGGGVQSTAALVLAATGRIDFPLFLFSNVGEDSENPDTLTYVTEVAAPYAAANGIELVELRRRRRDGSAETLLGQIDRQTSSTIIPVRMTNGAPGTRSCTRSFKVEVIAKETRRRGATVEDPAIVALGISVDEWQRANTNHRVKHQRVEYPLLDLGISRADCAGIIAGAGLPMPPRSACWFCPFHKLGYWVQLRQARPDLFARSVELEATLQSRRVGKAGVFLTRYGRTLDVITPDQPGLGLVDDDDACESGYCMV